MAYNVEINLLSQDSSHDDGEHVLSQVYPKRGTLIYSHDDAIACANRSKSTGGDPVIVLWGGRSRFNVDQLHALDQSGHPLESRLMPGQPGGTTEVVAHWLFNPPTSGQMWITQYGAQQVEAGWTLNSKMGHNAVGDPAYDWGLPEALYRWDDFLPEHEHEWFLNDVGRCYKIFAMFRPWWTEMYAPELWLENGVYRIELQYVDDCYVGMNGTEKIAPPDPLSFETRVFAGNTRPEWQLSSFLARNTVSHDFVHYGGPFMPGFEMRARWGIENPCAFVQSLTVLRVG